MTTNNDLHMKKLIFFASLVIIIISCAEKSASTATTGIPLTGTWRLLSDSILTGPDTAVTDYSKAQQKMLKIINDSHFAFLRHDVNQGKDSANAVFSAGAGRYTLEGDQYTEHLDFFILREWEGHTFKFTVSIRNDTLTQRGVERLEEQKIDRFIIETYVREK